jgi:flagellar hook assembly protein FlgD
VLNIAGRPVRTLAPRSCEAGINSLVWDGRSSVGLPAPDGLYLLSITARDEDGAESRALGRLYLRR